MSQNSNQPVREKSAKLQAIIDLVKEEINKGKTSAEIDLTMKEYRLTKEEEAQLIKETFHMQVQSELKQIERQNITTKLMIGTFLFFFGLFFTFLTFSSGGIILYIAIAMVLGGGWYVFKSIKEYKEL